MGIFLEHLNKRRGTAAPTTCTPADADRKESEWRVPRSPSPRARCPSPALCSQHQPSSTGKVNHDYKKIIYPSNKQRQYLLPGLSCSCLHSNASWSCWKRKSHLLRQENTARTHTQPLPVWNCGGVSPVTWSQQDRRHLSHWTHVEFH